MNNNQQLNQPNGRSFFAASCALRSSSSTIMTSISLKVNQNWPKILIFSLFFLGWEVCSGQSDPFAVRPMGTISSVPSNGQTMAPVASQGNYSYIRQKVFQIPYQLRSDSDPNQALNLYYSENRGQTWQLNQSVIPPPDPQSRRFNVSVRNDGEYWYAIRGSQTENRPVINFGIQPELRVVIDTTPPRLQIETQRTNDTATIYWTLFDQYPAPESIKFSYRFRDGDNWQAIPINIQDIRVHSTGISGQFNIPLLRGINYLEIQGEGSDRAQTPTLYRGPVSLDSPVDRRTVVPNQNWPVAGTASPGQEYVSGMLPKTTSNTGGAGTGGSTTTAPLPPDHPNSTWSPIRPTDAPVTPTPDPTLPDSYKKTTRYPFYPPPTVDLSTALIVNKPKFDLNYDIEAVGRSGVGSVELWYTRNQGKSWEILTRDPDTMSPVSVELPADGIFGLKLVVKNGAGIGDAAPLPGEPPQSWVILDRTAPTGELTNADIRVGTTVPQMRLRWKSDEQYPVNKPVSLHWAPNKDGPWQLIADQLDATGEYLWTMPDAIPARIAIKMEILDRGDNCGVSICPEIAADASRPRGFIRDIKTPQ